MGAQKAQSFSFGMNGQGLDSSVSKKSWGCSLAEGSPGLQDEYSPCLNERHGMGSLAFEPADEGKGVKTPLTPEAPEFICGAAQLTFPL